MTAYATAGLTLSPDRRGNKQLVAVCAANLVIYGLTKAYYVWRNKTRETQWNALTRQVRVVYYALSTDIILFLYIAADLHSRSNWTTSKPLRTPVPRGRTSVSHTDSQDWIDAFSRSLELALFASARKSDILSPTHFLYFFLHIMYHCPRPDVCSIWVPYNVIPSSFRYTLNLGVYKSLWSPPLCHF